MSGADDARLRIGEQHHAAIGARHPEPDAERRGGEAIATRPVAHREGEFHRQHVGRMNLVRHQKAARIDPDRRRHAPAVLHHGVHIVVRTDAAVERGVDAGRDAPVAGEKGVGDSGAVQ